MVLQYNIIPLQYFIASSIISSQELLGLCIVLRVLVEPPPLPHDSIKVELKLSGSNETDDAEE